MTNVTTNASSGSSINQSALGAKTIVTELSVGKRGELVLPSKLLRKSEEFYEIIAGRSNGKAK